MNDMLKTQLMTSKSKIKHKEVYKSQATKLNPDTIQLNILEGKIMQNEGKKRYNQLNREISQMKIKLDNDKQRNEKILKAKLEKEAHMRKVQSQYLTVGNFNVSSTDLNGKPMFVKEVNIERLPHIGQEEMEYK